MRNRRSPRRQESCDHETTILTVFAGIERMVCDECGHVSLAHQYDLVTEGSRRPNFSRVSVGKAE